MTHKTFNQELFDALVRHQIGLLNFSGGVRNKIWKLLDATEADMKRQILAARRAGLDTPAGVAATQALIKKLRESRLPGWKGARKEWFTDMRVLALTEADFLDHAMITAFRAVELGSRLPDPEVLRRIVSSKPFMGKTLKGWADDIQRADIRRIEDQIKIGLTQNETLPQIAKRVVGSAKLNGRDGVTQITRRNAEAITRTVTNGISAEARAEYLEANKDLAPQKLFTATLDSRTTPICRRFDGQLFDIDDPAAPVFPLHFGERSLWTPVVDGVVIGERPTRDFTEQSLLREFSEEQGFKAPKKRKDLPRGTKGAFDKFSRKRMRELTGRAPAKQTYQQWLRTQAAANQDDILGATKGKLFRDGGLTLDKFVTRDGREITLAELAVSDAKAFNAAGLDPAAFTD